MKTKKINIMCTAFRDGFQSVFGMRVQSKDYLPVVSEAVKAGLTYLESGGGAAFQSAFFYLNENAFDVMDAFRKAAGPKANLQTLARGVNVVALDSMSSDLIKLHAELFKKHGVTTVRNFDALNDPNNLKYSAECIKRAGMKHQLAIAMMSLPPKLTGAHTAEFYANRLKAFVKAKIPFDSLAFKDASGTGTPQTVYETIREARKIVGPRCPITYHSHETAGTGLACYLAAIEAGADTVDLSLAPVSGGTCQPDVATMWHALRGKPYELICDVDKVMQVEEDLKDALSKYYLPPEALHVDPRIPFSPMPGGALTANTQMLRDNNIMDKYNAIIDAMQEVVQKGGFGTSVTPVSQFYFQQAFNNVMYGKWKKMAEGYGKMVLGYFGKTPVVPDAKVVKIAAEQLGLKPTTETVLAINDKNPNKSKKHYMQQLKEAGLPATNENIFIAAACGQKGIDFLLGKGKVSVRLSESKTAPKANDSVITINGEKFEVKFDGSKAIVNGKEYTISEEKIEAPKGTENEAKASVGGVILAPMPGMVTQVLVSEGQVVKTGDTLVVVEVMKMETPIKATSAGTVKRLFVKKGDNIKTGDKVAEV
ncbi:MAG: biotin/lipoyl-binding protein [Alphaproteobacteria bacterium]|nr:biotin/lipoyl-binding protein [Alphaproteobacteria bacterium]